MDSKNDPKTRRHVLQELGGSDSDIEELLAYTENRFDVKKLPPPPVLPLADEPHVATWRRYLAESGGDTWDYLRARLPQLRIPIQAGISATDAYAEVMRRGTPFDPADFPGELQLAQPRSLRLDVFEHAAGALPVLQTSHRADFETLTRALAFRSEPRPINPSVNAQFVAGMINWDRVRAYFREWLADHVVDDWPEELTRVARLEKWRLHDSLILVCDAPYSDVVTPHGSIAMNAGEWKQRSSILRLEHEFSHYATKRLYGYMALNLLDEFICDWAGMIATMGRFDAGSLSLFMGLGSWPQVNPKGRVHTYRGSLSDGAFALLCALAIRAAVGLEQLTAIHYVPPRRTQFFLALTQMTLEGMTRPEAFQAAYDWAAGQLSPPPHAM